MRPASGRCVRTAVGLVRGARRAISEAVHGGRAMNVARLVGAQFTAVGLLIAGVAVPLVVGTCPAEPPVRLSHCEDPAGRADLVCGESRGGLGSPRCGPIMAAASCAVIVWGSAWSAATRTFVNVVVAVGAVGCAVVHSALALDGCRGWLDRVRRVWCSWALAPDCARHRPRLGAARGCRSGRRRPAGEPGRVPRWWRGAP
jgi:hypothetical protein